MYRKGCNLRCKWCHNPESRLPQRQMHRLRKMCQALPEGSVNAGYLLAKKLCDEKLLCKEDTEQMKLIECLLERYYGEIFGIDGEDEIFGKLTCSNGTIRTENGKLVLTFDV